MLLNSQQNGSGRGLKYDIQTFILCHTYSRQRPLLSTMQQKCM